MRGNAWQITAIISIILVVVLLIPVVILMRDRQTMNDQTTQARAEQTATAQRAATAERENEAMKALIGVAATVTFDELRRQSATAMARALPGEEDASRTYNAALAALLGDLEQAREAQRRANESLSQLQSDFNNAQDRYEAALAQVRLSLQRAEGERDDERRNFNAARAQLDRQLEEALRQQNATLSNSEFVQHQLQERVRTYQIANEEIRESSMTLANMLADVRNPNVEHPAGRVISVDQRAGTAIIDIGSVDGLAVRTMFSVYHSGITGLSFRTAPVDRDATYCDVCLREIARDVAKASVEVMQILGPHQARVRILDDILTDPIMVGDVVYSPIWKRGQHVRFALTAGMHLPGSSIESGNEAVKRLIEMNGGIVDAWINEMAADEDYLQGAISDFTNFIVVNERAPREMDREVARIHQALMESARNRAIKVISLEELLRRMGWRNMTPVDTFGALEFSSEMRVVPQHQGANRQSSGVVAPIFTPDNPAARVSPRDAIPVRSAPNAVSPLFDAGAPPPPISGGRTSELFRPRSPSMD